MKFSRSVLVGSQYFYFDTLLIGIRSNSSLVVAGTVGTDTVQ